ncbi:sulfonate-binding protein [Parafrankia soli]|uniref:Sulfonate-binding protein n=2 Tax=Parafrankia soli TaxID=2599596 RepID=A0A1S1PIC4_9ACTN|nr:sulfonate-binding protein [Parafrankia soli]
MGDEGRLPAGRDATPAPSVPLRVLMIGRPTGRRSRRLLVVVPLALAGLLAAACGGSDPAPGTAAAAANDLSGVTLRFGDQVNGVRSVLEASGELEDTPYKIEWSQFQGGGPTVIAAQTGGDVDLGVMGETPVVFAQAAHSPVTVVGAARIVDPAKSNFALVVKKDSPIRSVADLRGATILNSQGTVSQYLVAKALEKGGLTTDDVKLVNLQQGAQAAYDRGDIDVIASGGPPLAMMLAKGTDRVLMTGAGVLPGVNYLVARNGALSDAGLSDAIGDFLGRLAQAQDWYNAHPDAAIAIVKPTYKVDDTVARAIIDLAPLRYVPIDRTVTDAHQREADFFADQGVLKAKIDTSTVFDDRYNPIINAVAQGRPGPS